MDDLSPLGQTADRLARTAIRPHVAAWDLLPDTAALHEAFAQLGLLDAEALQELSLADAVELLWALGGECAATAAHAAYILAGQWAAQHFHVELPGSVCALAVWEDAELDLDTPTPQVSARLAAGSLQAHKRSVVLAPVANAFAVLCRRANGDGSDADDGALVLAWLGERAGVQVDEPLATLGLHAMPVADVRFGDDASGCVPQSVTPVGAAELVYLFGLVGLLTATCATAAATAALDAARRYADERYQGGVMIHAHDAIGLMLAQHNAALAAARTTLFDAARQSPPRFDACLAARRATSDVAVAAALDAVQILGGYGYMRDFGIEKRLRDVVALALLPADNSRLALMQERLGSS